MRLDVTLLAGEFGQLHHHLSPFTIIRIPNYLSGTCILRHDAEYHPVLDEQALPCPASGDVAGIGWERSEGTPPPPGQAPKGRVYFTYCGQRLSPFLEDVAGGMWPLVHIQKKVGVRQGTED